MSAARVAGAGASLLVHAALLLQTLVTPPVPAAKSGVPTRPEGASDLEWRLMPNMMSGVGAGLSCAHSFRGIGVKSSLTGLVTELAPGGPAEVAGVRVGDYFMNSDHLARDQYEIGREVLVRLERDGKPLVVAARISRICYEESQRSSIPHLHEHP